MSVSGCIKRLVLRQEGATASEYATILAVVVIAFMVSINILGRKVSKTVRSVDHRLIKSSGAGGGSETPSDDSGDDGSGPSGSDAKGDGPGSQPNASSKSGEQKKNDSSLRNEMKMLNQVGVRQRPSAAKKGP